MSEPIRIVVSGSRGTPKMFARMQVARGLSMLKRALGITRQVIVHHGDSGSVDKAADIVCPYVQKHPADWKRHGKAAGFLRNIAMANIVDAGVIVWDGDSKGTLHMMASLARRGKPFICLPAKTDQ